MFISSVLSVCTKTSEAPLAKPSMVSLVEVSPSTLTRLKVIFTASTKSFCHTARSRPASHSTTASMVAILGQIIPAPLVIPAKRTVPDERCTSLAANLGKASVVIMALVKCSSSLVPRLSLSIFTAAGQRSILR